MQDNFSSNFSNNLNLGGEPARRDAQATGNFGRVLADRGNFVNVHAQPRYYPLRQSILGPIFSYFGPRLQFGERHPAPGSSAASDRSPNGGGGSINSNASNNYGPWRCQNHREWRADEVNNHRQRSVGNNSLYDHQRSVVNDRQRQQSFDRNDDRQRSVDNNSLDDDQRSVAIDKQREQRINHTDGSQHKNKYRNSQQKNRNGNGGKKNNNKNWHYRGTRAGKAEKKKKLSKDVARLFTDLAVEIDDKTNYDNFKRNGRGGRGFRGGRGGRGQTV